MKPKHLTKIITTLGPASQSSEIIESLLQSGTNVFRLNFSHGNYEEHSKTIEIIRKLEKKISRPIGILMDLQGPKFRVGIFKNKDGTVLKKGSKFRFDTNRQAGDDKRVTLPHPEIFESLRPNASILVNDGHLRLKVTKCGSNWADTEVLIPGKITNRKGVNLPDTSLRLPAITQKDEKDINFGLNHGIDWIALSFVQQPEDIRELRKRVGNKATIIAKLEKPSALDYLDEIIELSDGIMIARGDLGVEIPLERVPVLQKKIIHACRQAGKPSVVATQMLESMIESPVPTRAEASDVATAVYDGADAVMLSAETATGKFPDRAVVTMKKIIEQVEKDHNFLELMSKSNPKLKGNASDAITAAARQIASNIPISALVTYTTSGSTTLRASRERPPTPIICITPSQSVARRFSMVWGVQSVINKENIPDSDIGKIAAKTALDQGISNINENLIVTAGIPFGTIGSTNTLRVVKIEE